MKNVGEFKALELVAELDLVPSHGKAMIAVAQSLLTVRYQGAKI